MEKASEGPQPAVTFFQPRDHQDLLLYSQKTSSEAVLKRFVPRSHLAKVIIQDNVSVQRVQEMKTRQIEGRRKKAENTLDQMKKRFLQNQQKKTFRWKKEHNYYQKMLEEIDQRNQLRELGSAFLKERSLSGSGEKPLDKPNRLR